MTSFKYGTVVPAQDEDLESPNRTREICRICLEEGTPEAAVIRPCRCKGSLEVVHEDCLKSWLVTRSGCLDEAKCELCHTQFQMKFQVKRKYSVEHFGMNNKYISVSGPVLFVLLCVMALASYSLGMRLIERTGNTETTSALFVVCIVSTALLSWYLVKEVTSALTILVLEEWHIFDQTFEDEEPGRVNEQRSSTVKLVRIRGQPVLTNPIPCMIPAAHAAHTLNDQTRLEFAAARARHATAPRREYDFKSGEPQV